MPEAGRRAQSGSLQQAAERFRLGAACVRVIQGHERRGHPESFVLLHLPAQPGLRWRWLDPTANKVVIFLRAVNAGQVVPQVPVLLAGAKNRGKVSLQLIGCERQVRGMHNGGHKPTVDAPNRRRHWALTCRAWCRFYGLRDGGQQAQCQVMTNLTELTPAPSDCPVPIADHLRLAVAAYLARFKGSSRKHTESDVRYFLAWCAERGLDPLAARRPHLELYIRWMQEIRRFKPSTVSRRVSVMAGFYRTCVIDGVLEHSPAEHVRRPSVPAESPTLGFTHLQFEALLTAARQSAKPCDFALVAMLGLLGLRIFEATGPTSPTLVKSTATGCCECAAKEPRSSGPAAASGRPECESPGHTRTCSVILLSRPCSMPAWTCGTFRSQPATPIHAPRCVTTGPARTLTAIRTTSWPPTWPPAPDPAPLPRLRLREIPGIAE